MYKIEAVEPLNNCFNTFGLGVKMHVDYFDMFCQSLFKQLFFDVGEFKFSHAKFQSSVCKKNPYMDNSELIELKFNSNIRQGNCVKRRVDVTMVIVLRGVCRSDLGDTIIKYKSKEEK